MFSVRWQKNREPFSLADFTRSNYCRSANGISSGWYPKIIRMWSKTYRGGAINGGTLRHHPFRSMGFSRIFQNHPFFFSVSLFCPKPPEVFPIFFGLKQGLPLYLAGITPKTPKSLPHLTIIIFQGLINVPIHQHPTIGGKRNSTDIFFRWFEQQIPKSRYINPNPCVWWFVFRSFSSKTPIWLVVWLTFLAFSRILGISSSQLTFISCRGVAQPPTSHDFVAFPGTSAP